MKTAPVTTCSPGSPVAIAAPGIHQVAAQTKTNAVQDIRGEVLHSELWRNTQPTSQRVAWSSRMVAGWPVHIQPPLSTPWRHGWWAGYHGLDPDKAPVYRNEPAHAAWQTGWQQGHEVARDRLAGYNLVKTITNLATTLLEQSLGAFTGVLPTAAWAWLTRKVVTQAIDNQCASHHGAGNEWWGKDT